MKTGVRVISAICNVVAMLATLPLAVEAASRQALAEAREQLRQAYAADEPGAVAVARLLVHFSEGKPPTVLEPVAEWPATGRDVGRGVRFPASHESSRPDRMAPVRKLATNRAAQSRAGGLAVRNSTDRESSSFDPWSGGLC